MPRQNLWFLAFAILAAFALLAALGFHAKAAEPVSAASSENATILTGGIGEAERTHLLELSTRYELVASFAQHSDGAMLTHVDVTITGKTLKEPIELTTDGPLFIASLPTGHYVVKARLPGWKEEVREVDVERFHNRRVWFTFVPASE
jgi:hypothetical protein